MHSLSTLSTLSCFLLLPQLCDDVRNGCKHKLASAQNKLIMKTVSFTVPAPDFAKDNLFAEFSAELSLMV